MHWRDASAPDSDGDEMVKQWKSLMSHLCNTHNECYHETGDIPANEICKLLCC